MVEDNSVRGQIVGNGLYNATFRNNVVVQAAATQYAESGVSPLMTLGFVARANVSNCTFISGGSWADFVSGSVPTVLPVGISVWGSIWDRFRGTAAADGPARTLGAELRFASAVRVIQRGGDLPRGERGR